MSRIITDSEMKRRQAMAAAKCDITDAMAEHSLTVVEWLNVLTEVSQRMIEHGLKEDWEVQA